MPAATSTLTAPIPPPRYQVIVTAAIAAARHKCPYLDTVNRSYLDFDFEKVCSVSLSNMNVYSCLVCGKFFQGRGPHTQAHTHSVQAFHHVFMNLHNAKIYCLPDNYEVQDSSLDDIKLALFPTFSPAEIGQLDRNTTLIRDVHGVSYLPGFVGLNNLKSTDYVNVIVQALAHVVPVRDFFLQPAAYEEKAKAALVLRFGEVVRKLWSKDNFKSTVSPHDLLQEVAGASKKHFRIGKQGDAIEFLSWLLNQLHLGLGGTPPGSSKKAKGSVIFESFQGEIKVLTQTKKKRAMELPGAAGEEEDDGTGRGPGGGGGGDDGPGEGETQDADGTWTESVAKAPFLFLTVDIPQTPLFKDSQGGIIIPQVPLYTVMEKFGGEKLMDVVKGGVHQRKRYWITRLPRYLILSLARLTKNHFFVEKNPTIVNFPVKNLELKDYFFPEIALPTDADLAQMPLSELKGFLVQHGGSTKGAVERGDLKERAKRVVAELGGTKYDLVANVVHDSPPGQQEKKDAQRRGEEAQAPPGTYRVHVFNRASDQWYEIQDLHVQETLPQLITISESCVLIYEKKGVVENLRAAAGGR